MMRFVTTSFLKVMFASLFLMVVSPAVPTHAQAPEAPNVQGEAKDQGRLTTEVRHQLVTLSSYSAYDYLTYRVDGNKVYLYGQVVDPSLKDAAAKAVKGIEGVQHVENQIEVLPSSAMDDEIRMAEFQSIYSFRALQKYSNTTSPPIHIVVDDRRVTLEGLVDSQADKDAVGARATMVPGVFSVTNNLHIEKAK